ncbi:transcriptional regulator [Actinomadura hibisca]|uniref:transcriptional regulator n=1 Tax=Actinomadura hibisca TaxID=68565 RepID=UPI00082F526C|nr:transcriptional regulator [Actinomadura hibisca]
MRHQPPSTPPPWAVRIRAERETRGWGKRAMARQLLGALEAPLQERRISSLARQLGYWEAGTHYPRDWAPWFARAFGVDEAELFGTASPAPTFGKTLTRLMAWRGVHLRELAETAGCDVSDLVMISNDLVLPSRPLAERLDTALDAQGKLIALVPAESASSVPPGLPAVSVEETIRLDDEDDMERRRLLLAALGLGAGALGSSGEPVRQLLADALDSEPRTLEEWHLAYLDHRYGLASRSPAQVRDALIIDLIAVRRQLATAGPREKPELERVVAALSTVLANALTRLGEDGAAIRWWRTAKAAADRSEDLDLRLMVRAEEAGCGLYGQRPPAMVLHLAEQAGHLADGPARSGLVMAGCHRAKALALEDRREEAHRALADVTELLSGQVPAAEHGYSDQILISSFHFAQSWVYARTGDEGPAADARARVLETPGLDYQYRTNVGLHEAQCTVIKGGVDTGVRQAADILAELPAQQRSHVIGETGRAVLRAVPVEQRQRAAVRELREVLAQTAPSPALGSGA